MINETLIKIIREARLNVDNSICYLLAIHYGIKPDCFSKELISKLNMLNLFSQDKYGVTWNYPLFEEQQTAFGWVETEYIPLFRAANPSRGKHLKACLLRMKKFFAENPNVRQDDVISAVKRYLAETDGMYIKEPHYFITKGVGVDKVSLLEEWVEIDTSNSKIKRISSNNTIE